MNRARAIECGVALRMTSANAELGGAAAARPPIVVFDGTPEARRLGGQLRALEVRAGDMGLGLVLSLPRRAGPEDVRAAVAAAIRETRTVPAVVGLAQGGIWAAGRNGPEARQTLALLLGREKPRRAGRARAPSGRLVGRVALITGGAQGFGRGIAEELAREGAAVVLADINAPLGRAAAEALNALYGAGTARFVRADVTSAASLEAAVAAAAAAFGGVDLFIANAGVLRAGGLAEMDAETFELVTRTNYTAYFLSVKAVAPLMKRQHELNPGHVMDIIQINSKSGLEGSNRNFAYAGSKFGGIGLTQSFALELAPHGIKVNAICPGNYFDGPLWSDPERGLFVQYLRAGKVPGAKTIEDVRRHYVAKVPMGRGCLPRDVARAILYLHEQEYETGQALPVTGGQVMLR